MRLNKLVSLKKWLNLLILIEIPLFILGWLRPKLRFMISLPNHFQGGMDGQNCLMGLT